MKKLLILLMLAVGVAAASAQKFAMIDMEYVLRNLPAYERANEQLNKQSQAWEKEVNALVSAADDLYADYQQRIAFLSADARKKAEETIVAKEREASELRSRYFGPEGELFKKRKALMEPIQEEVYEAVKAVATAAGYQAIFDRASSQSIVFATPSIDISNEVLAKLGYSK